MSERLDCLDTACQDPHDVLGYFANPEPVTATLEPGRFRIVGTEVEIILDHPRQARIADYVPAFHQYVAEIDGVEFWVNDEAGSFVG